MRLEVAILIQRRPSAKLSLSLLKTQNDKPPLSMTRRVATHLRVSCAPIRSRSAWHDWRKRHCGAVFAGAPPVLSTAEGSSVCEGGAFGRGPGSGHAETRLTKSDTTNPIAHSAAEGEKLCGPHLQVRHKTVARSAHLCAVSIAECSRVRGCNRSQARHIMTSGPVWKGGV